MRSACAVLALSLGWASIAHPQDMPATNRIRTTLADGSFVGAAELQRLALAQLAIGRAIPRALVNSDTPEAAELARAIAGWPLTPDRALEEIAGDWSCTTLHLRRDSAVVVSPASGCHVTGDGKLTTAQGLRGRLLRDEGLLLLLVDAAENGRQALGVLQVTDADRARVYFPAPDDRGDSLDLMVMQRVTVSDHETGRGSVSPPRP